MANDLPLLFLDTDGVMLKRRQWGLLDAFELAPGCLEFLEWAAMRFRCRWLSARYRQGWPDGSHRAFRLAGACVDDPQWAVLDLVERATWTVSKIEATDAASDFWRVDDDPAAPDRDWLRFHRREDRLIAISVDHDSGVLAVDRAMLERAITSREEAGMIPAIRFCDLSILKTSQLQDKYPYDEKATGKQSKPKNRKEHPNQFHCKPEIDSFHWLSREEF